MKSVRYRRVMTSVLKPFKPFIIEVESGSDNKFTIPTTGGGYNYSVKTSDGQTFTGVTGNLTITFPSPNTHYDVEISGLFPRIYFNNGSERLKIKDIKQWGDIVWGSMQNALYGCSNLGAITATDAPDLTMVTNMSAMVRACTNLEADLSTWGVHSGITSLSGFSFGCTKLIFDGSNWDVSGVTDFGELTSNRGASITGVENWDMSSATSLKQMIWGNPKWNLTNGTNVVKLNTSGSLTNIYGVIGGPSPYTTGVTSLEITNCTNVSDTTNAFLRASGLTSLILTNIGVSFDIATTALTGIGIDNLAGSVRDMTGFASPSVTMTLAQRATCDQTLWTNKNWTIIAI